MTAWSKGNTLKSQCSLFVSDVDSEYHQFLNDPEDEQTILNSQIASSMLWFPK